MQLVTNGAKVTEYRPSDNDKAVDILVRFPPDRRSLEQIDELRIQTPAGHVPIGNFVTRVPAQRVGNINRISGNRVITVSSNVAEGAQSAVVQKEVAAELAKTDLGPNVTFRLKGEDEEREKAGAFLMKAFGTAMFLIFAILLAQFNKFTSVGLVLTAVVLSTIGVLIGLMVMGQPFGVVMTGIGVIANAGVIVNNNIVLIDTYDRLRREGVAAYEAILETCRERARPVVLTAVTAILGVLPIAFGMNIEFLDARDHRRGAGDAVVDFALDRDRVRPRLCDRADLGGDARRPDGDREPRGVARAPQDAQGGAARGAPCGGAAGGIRGAHAPRSDAARLANACHSGSHHRARRRRGAARARSSRAACG